MLRVWQLLCFVGCAGSATTQPRPPSAPAPARRPYVPVPPPCTSGCEIVPDQVGHSTPPDESRPDPASTADTAASCGNIGAAIAAIELGNYAEEDQLAPVVTKYEASCLGLRLDSDTRKCVFAARDKFNMAYCAPGLFPEVPMEIVAAAECAKIVDQIRASGNQIKPVKLDPRYRQVRRPIDDPKVREALLSALKRSCTGDRWPTAFGNCARTLSFPSQISACYGAAPQPLQRRIYERMAGVTPPSPPQPVKPSY